MDELCKVWEDEKIKFSCLRNIHLDDIEKIEIKCAFEWLSIYKIWHENLTSTEYILEDEDELANFFHRPEYITEI